MEPLTKFETLFSGESFLRLENGSVLSNIEASYQTYGELNANGDNAVLICHALTGLSHAAGIVSETELNNCSDKEFLTKYNKMTLGKTGWWDPLIGPGKVFDTNKYYVICSNILGSCYGTTGPSSQNIDGEKFNYNFPKITIRDMVNVQKALLDKLNVKKIKTMSGGSLGGMQILEWAYMFGDMIESIIPIATSAAHSAWAIGWGEASRRAIQNDPEWKNGNYEIQPYSGISLARKSAMISYRTYDSFHQKFGREKQTSFLNKENEIFSVENYLDYQGEKFVKRFDANSYLVINEAMDTMDIGRNRGGIQTALSKIQMPALCIGIDSDILYPASEQREIAGHLANSTYEEIKSIHGHDAFLIEFDQLEKMISTFLKKNNL